MDKSKFEKKEFYDYVKKNKISNPDMELFIRYAKMKGQTEEEMRSAVGKNYLYLVDKIYSRDYKDDLPHDGKVLNTSKTKTEPKNTNSQIKPMDSNNEEEISNTQIANLNKIKDTIRNNLSTKQIVDLRRYLSNE